MPQAVAAAVQNAFGDALLVANYVLGGPNLCVFFRSTPPLESFLFLQGETSWGL